MKNLKKVLALGLALVMILGMFTIASAAETKKTAADFTDWDKVEHKDAVALCVDLGIINGLPDGSFDPQGTLDRASWAKLVYFTATGDDNADAYLGTATGMNDIKGNWAESYINYLVANKYVSGDGLGNFLPTGTVTVAAGLKTMLTVLGYDADDRGYQNDAAWAGNVITDAKRNGLMDDIDRSNTANVNLTRDNAAQIVYNALQAETKLPEYRRDNGVTYVVKYEDGGKLAANVFGVKPITATVADVNDGIATFKDSGYDAILNGADVKAAASSIGNKVTVFITTDGKEVISTTVAKAGSAADKTFTKGVTIENIVKKSTDKDLKNDFVANAVDSVTTGENTDFLGSMQLFEDGVEITENVLAKTYKSGDVVEVFLAEGKVSMIKATTYDVDTVEGAVETRTYKDDEQVKIPGVIGGFTNVDKVDGWQGLAEDDVVLINSSKGVTYLEKAEKITGKITRRVGAKLTINGTQYAESGLVKDNEGTTLGFATWDPSKTKDNEYDFFLDKNGDICALNKISGETTTETAFVLDAAYKNTGANNGLDGGDEYQQAKLLFTDGTTEVVRVNKLYNETSNEYEKIEENKSAEIKGMVEFSVDSKGYYEIKILNGTVTESATEIKQDPDFATDLKADEKTVFMVEKVGEDDSEFFIYTSYKNVPKMTASAVCAVTDKGYVTYVYLKTDKFAGDGSEGLIYLKDQTNDEKDIDGNQIYEVVDAQGNEVSLSLVFASGSSAETGSFYVITSTDEKGVATVRKASESGDKADYIAATEMKAGSGVVTVGENAYSTADTVCVLIDKDSDGAFVSAATTSVNKVDTAEEGYDFQVLLIADGTAADFLYVVRSPEAAQP